MYRVGQAEVDAVANVILNGKMFRQLDPAAPIHEVLDFEAAMKVYLQAEQYFLLTSGKGALICGLVAAGVGPGDEVIVPAYTYIATALAVTAVGAIPVVAEIDETLGMDPEDFRKKITPQTKAVIPVHMQGMPCDMDAILSIAKEHHIFVLEDACQALGAEYHGKKLGTLGDAGAYSYNYYKIISAGEGGGFTARDPEVFRNAYIHHDSSGVPYFGANIPNIEELIFGGNEYRANEIQAAIMRVQLSRLEGILRDLRRNRDAIAKAVEGSGLRIKPSNDAAGDNGTILAFTFDTAAEAERFELATGSSRPINLSRHIYSEWGPILNKRAAYNDAMNAYKLPQNQGLRMDLTVDSCKKSLEILARNVYLTIDPDWTQAQLDAVIRKVLDAAKQ